MAREYPDRPYVGIGVVVWRGGSVLLIRRGKAPRAGEWSLPGGAQDVGETVAEAGRREVEEETGLAVNIGEVVAVVDMIDRDQAGAVRYHYTLIDLQAEWIAGNPVAGDDAEEAVFVPLDALDRIELWTETRRIIELAAAQRQRSPRRS
jgi:ADP-ribose pyrophosphatase YjhB (NUDIX family)